MEGVAAWVAEGWSQAAVRADGVERLWAAAAPHHATIYAALALLAAWHVGSDQARRWSRRRRRRRTAREIESCRPLLDAFNRQFGEQGVGCVCVAEIVYLVGVPRVVLAVRRGGATIRFAATGRTHADAVARALHCAAAQCEELVREERRQRAEHLRDTIHDLFEDAPDPRRDPPWRAVLGVKAGATRDDVVAAHRRLAKKWHPDRPGGSERMMSKINNARDEALASLD